jgi:alanine-synthesizing transaminase
MFSSRTNWHLAPNRITTLLSQRREAGKSVLDLTVTNPTVCGIPYPHERIQAALAHNGSTPYQPDPRGLPSAREVISEFYGHSSAELDQSAIILTASTSESYTWLFRLLCEPGDEVLVPRPSYPLFEHLAQLADIRLRPYPLYYDGQWGIDVEALRDSITARTKALILIHPHNPTGMYVPRDEYHRIRECALQRTLPLIIDEVFGEYPLDPIATVPKIEEPEILTFRLNGISKLLGMPHLKLGWIAVSGTPRIAKEALERLEMIADTYLSVNTPVQHALGDLFDIGKEIRTDISRRTRENIDVTDRVVRGSTCTRLHVEGGWSMVIQLPRTKTDEQWTCLLLDESGVLIHPGHFYEFPDDRYVVVSLLPDPGVLRQGIIELVKATT